MAYAIFSIEQFHWFYPYMKLSIAKLSSEDCLTLTLSIGGEYYEKVKCFTNSGDEANLFIFFILQWVTMGAGVWEGTL